MNVGRKLPLVLKPQGTNPAPSSNMMKLKWNDELAEIAQRYVDQCVFGHDKKRNMCDGTYAGQNAYAGYSSKEEDMDRIMATVPKPVNNWYSEVKDFSPASIDRNQ